jgi:protein-tyrosine phosphatase
MAMALWQSKVKKAAAEWGTDWHEHWRIESAGTWAPEGEPAATKTQMVLNERGIELRNHRSRQVTREILTSFNLILTMEQGQKEALRVEFPEIASRVYMLSEMIDLRFEVKDPMGGPVSEFREIALEIEDILARGFHRINRLAEK